jgi:two-component system LytT family response regulator
MTAMDVLIVDDEAPGRQRLRELLARESAIGAIREAENGEVAVEQIRARRPDLLFLDVQMPAVDGLQVVEMIGAEHMPFTVFVTAHDRHAVSAFDANAIDYLLKPFSDERFETAMSRVRARAAVTGLTQNLQGLVNDGARRKPLDRLLVKLGEATHLLPTSDIDWIEASGVYVNLRTRERAWLHRASLLQLETQLDPARFVRIHRSTIVNLDRILRLESLTHGEFEVVLKCGARLKLSRSFRAHLEGCLGQAL